MSEDMIPRSEANAMVAAAYEAAAKTVFQWWSKGMKEAVDQADVVRALTPDDARKAEADVIRAAVAAALMEAASVAQNACPVPPDGGSPTEDEENVCRAAADYILALITAPADRALAGMLADARAKGMEEAAKIARAYGVWHHIRSEKDGACVMREHGSAGTQIETQILARAAEVREKNDER